MKDEEAVLIMKNESIKHDYSFLHRIESHLLHIKILLGCIVAFPLILEFLNFILEL
ncbi:MAG: hypothetical protein KA318_00190 [Nitrosomonas sp.]|nr:hypothetical protein [Nitrosomonas sp.]